MKKFSKVILLLVCLAMVASMFAGCGDNGLEYVDIETASKEELDPAIIGDYGSLKLPLDNKGTTIRMLCATDVDTNNDSPIVKELRRRTGINVQIVAVPLASYNEKAKVLIATKEDMPEIIHPTTFNPDEINDLGMQGAFVDILKYQDELPNFKKYYIDEAEERGIGGAIKNSMASSGQLFMFPVYDVSRDVNHGMLYRKDIFDKYGIEMWHDQESFLNAMRELKKLYPNSTPFASKTKTAIFRDIGYSWGLFGMEMYYDESEGLWKYGCIDPKFKEVLDFIQVMYNEKLIDPEFLTATQNAWTNKMTQADKAFVTWDWIGRLDQFSDSSTVPGYDLRYGNPIGGKVITLGRTGNGSVVKSGPAELLCLQLCDYLLSNSGGQLMSMGIEGVTYNAREDGRADYIGFEGQKGVSINDLEAKYGLYIAGVYHRFDRRSSYYDFTEREQEAQDLMNSKEDGYMPIDPVLAFTAEERDIRSQYESGLAKASEEFATKYILNGYGEKEWNEWVEKAKSLGADKVAEQYNKAQERYDQLDI